MLKNTRDGGWGEIERMRDGSGAGGRERRTEDSSFVLIFEEARDRKYI